MLRKGQEVLVVSIADVLFLAAKGFYTEVHFEYSGLWSRQIVCKPISVLCKEWEDPEIMRVHRSYAVHKSRIDTVERKGRNYTIRMGAYEIPVARSYAGLIPFLMRPIG
jgi:DNA-binding LytR/AlgR family response regulator